MRVVLLMLAFAVANSSMAAEDDAGFSRAWQAHLINPEDRTRFGLVSISAGRDYFEGTAEFENYIKGNPDPAPAVIKGARLPNGSFWPFATLQVSDSMEGPWQTIGRSAVAGEPATITVAAGKIISDLAIDLSAFRPVRRQKRWGRIVLETGDDAVIELKELLPPRREP